MGGKMCVHKESQNGLVPPRTTTQPVPSQFSMSLNDDDEDDDDDDDDTETSVPVAARSQQQQQQQPPPPPPPPGETHSRCASMVAPPRKWIKLELVLCLLGVTPKAKGDLRHQQDFKLNHRLAILPAAATLSLAMLIKSSSCGHLFFIIALLLLLLPQTAHSFPLLEVSRRDVGLSLISGGGVIMVSTSSSTTVSSSAAAAADAAAVDGGGSSNSNIRWGIVGLGDVTQTKSGPPFWKCTGSELVAVMRRTPGKAAAFAARVPTKSSGVRCKGYDDLEAFLQHPGLEAVYVCTRPGTHLELVQQIVATAAALPRSDEDQIRAIYVEKPCGRCAQEIEAMIQCVKQVKGMRLYTAYISRAYERTQYVKRLLWEPAAGGDGNVHDRRNNSNGSILGDRLVSVKYTLRGTGGARGMEGNELPWRLDVQQSGGGLVMDVGCHVLDRIDYLCGGPLVDVQGTAENRKSPDIPVEDYCSLRAKIGDARPANDDRNISGIVCHGATVECTWDFGTTEPSCDELIFQGSSGYTLVMAGMSPNGPVRILDATGKVVAEQSFAMPEHTAQRMIQGVTNDLLGNAVDDDGRVDYLSFGDNALRTHQVMDEMLTSYYGGREIGFWSRQDLLL